ncbi:MAG TPA: hypothetical protein VFZ61_30745 [Polyangiales bacterium]
MRAGWYLALALGLSACAAEREPRRPEGPIPGQSPLAESGVAPVDAAPVDAARSDAAVAGGDAGVNASAGLPCAVAEVLRTRCQLCHAEPPSNAPMALVTRRDLLAPGLSDKSMRMVDLVISSIEDNFMPPSSLPRPTPEELAALRAWVAAGTPEASCGNPLPDAGSGAGAGPFDTPVMCSSGKFWEEDDGEGDKMRPGRACISCHLAESSAPDWTIAGTVYPSAHEPDHCHGADDSDIEVVITGADGRELRLEVNSVGNFHSQERVVFPIRARVLMNGRERRMGAMQNTGDCNSCHTQQGANGAPGRIMLP